MSEPRILVVPEKSVTWEVEINDGQSGWWSRWTRFESREDAQKMVDEMRSRPNYKDWAQWRVVKVTREVDGVA